MTNAVLLDEQRIAFFKEHPPALIQATLYGNSEDTYERVTGSRVFHRVIRHLSLIKEAGMPLSVSITPSLTLGEDVFETVRLAYDFTKSVLINSSLFTPEDEEWRNGERENPSIEFYARILRFQRELIGLSLKKVSLEELPEPGGNIHSCDECGLLCGGGRSSFVVSWKGNLKICNRMSQEESVRSLGFSEAWKRLNHAASAWPQVPECTECPYETVCSKCAAVFKDYTAPGQKPDAYCQQIKYLVSQGVLPASECKLSREHPGSFCVHQNA
jgi:radical SAM protein with 4Fe4S-binding SPASM domain